jgi:C-terminal processing protease CtpA/Prc
VGHSKRISLLLVGIFVTLNSCAQNFAHTVPLINSELLKQDFKIFQDSVEQLHAGLYRYRSKVELDRVFDSAYLLLSTGMSIADFYLLLRNVISNIQDGHTSCNLPPDLANHYISNEKMFPVQLRFINDKAYVPCKQAALPVASEITAIDNKSIDEIRERLFSYLPSDGANQTKKYCDLNSDSFIPLYFLVFGGKKTFSVEYKTDDGKTGIQTLNAGLLQNSQCQNPPLKKPKYLELDFKPGKIAILMIKTFSSHLLNSPDEYANFLESSFKQIKNKGISKLVIDLRDNGGGHDVYGSMLYSYLTSKPYRYYSSLESTSGKFQEQHHPNLRLQQPAENNFKGKVYFLVNGNSFSTTAEFCSIAKSNERGVFIGEETGGAYYGNTSGGNARIVLPNSKIIVNIPKTKYTMAVKEAKHKDRGIIPDFIITPGISDVVRNWDVQLHYALKLAEGR